MSGKIEKIKDFYGQNKEKVVFFGGIILVMLIIIIVIAVAVKVVGNKASYESLEEKLEVAAEKYLRENPGNMPTSTNPTVVVEASTLVEGKYIKELNKYVKDSSCTGNVVVDYKSGDYKYQSYLTCNKYKTQKLLEVLKKNNQISPMGEGLYEMNNALVYRGTNPNNFIKFNNELWRIVKIDKDNSIHIIRTPNVDEDLDDAYGVWSESYNTEMDYQYGSNIFRMSQALTTINNLYEKKYKPYQKNLVKNDLCYGKRADESIAKDGSIECNERILNQYYIGLLPIYDYMNASLDGLCTTTISKECQNYNYLVNDEISWWTMTGSLQSTAHVYMVSYNGEVEADYASSAYVLRYVIYLDADTLYSGGTGTYEDPYTIKIRKEG